MSDLLPPLLIAAALLIGIFLLARRTHKKPRRKTAANRAQYRYQCTRCGQAFIRPVRSGCPFCGGRYRQIRGK